MAEPVARPLLLGEAPSRGGDRYHAFPLSGRPAQVLCRLAGIPPQADGSTYGKWTWALYDRFDCRNIFERFAEATPWRAAAARGRALEALRDDRPLVVVCLGRRAQAAAYGALNLRTVRSGPSAWGGVFGNYGAWMPPWATRTGKTLTHDPGVEPWLVTIPHPSGLNRALNDPTTRAACGKILREALELAATGGTVHPRA